ncbi:class I SAM-dependent methyltransferase [Salidesulfovibrio onnuriiensis]|uniref:class I SAM-dependent methyltransferase n=1 Tax=Salidesulfovibrio onnuriiensis TaxID=2583823 RepID=UPI0011CCB3B5|nr:class I SAM-dependent methyltransferase [Salidesulfovibrio onnuriiensis]
MIAQNAKTSKEQSQTADTFGFKWSKRDTYESEAFKARTEQWLLERYCGGDRPKLAAMLGEGRKVILDAGCGASYSALLLFGDLLAQHEYIGVDISSSVEVAAKRFKEHGFEGRFMQNDLMHIDIPDESVDMIFSEGVLHHTDSVEEAVGSLSHKLKIGGHFLFYVYVKKSPVREYTDDYIREQLTPMDNEQAWEALESLTKLGKTLGDLNTTIDIPEDVSLLGIPKGKIDIQRLFYWHICKMFYDKNMDIGEMNHINFDWFRPLNCIRSTPEQVRAYCDQAGLDIEHMDIQNSGITVVAVKR